jgi:hypothetical protein
MSLDKSLALAGAKRPTMTDRKSSRRFRLISRIQAQLEVLGKVRAGEPLNREERRLQKWFWHDSGNWFVSIYYTRKPIELAKGKWSIQCKDLDGVATALQTITKSVEAGDFDDPIEALAETVKKKFKKAA